MSGVWVFKNGVAKLVANPLVESLDGDDLVAATALRPTQLVYTPTDEAITNYEMLEEKLLFLGWEVNYGHHDSVRQYHKSHTPHLITLPAEFHKLKPMHMYDIVVKCRSNFEVGQIELRRWAHMACSLTFTRKYMVGALIDLLCANTPWPETASSRFYWLDRNSSTWSGAIEGGPANLQAFLDNYESCT